jgi:hypothetical protein
MKLNKATSLFLSLACICFMLLSACSSDAGTRSAANGHAPTPTATKAKAASTATTLPADCPAAGTIRSVQLPPDTKTAQPAVFYLAKSGGVQSGIAPLALLRYDLTTGKTSTIFTFPRTAAGYREQVHLSPDKHWLLISHTRSLDDNTSMDSVQLVRTDGTRFITLACSSLMRIDHPAPGSRVGGADWLPDGRQIAITVSHTDQQQNVKSSTIEVLNLATGTSHPVLLPGNYTSYAWLDDHRLIVDQTSYINNTAKDDYSIYDASKKSIQDLPDFTRMISDANDVVISSDRSQFFAASFDKTRSSSNNSVCKGPGDDLIGPSALKSAAISGGPASTIYASKSLAILRIQPVSGGILLMYIGNTAGDMSQNGLWKINTDGTGLTRLTTAHDQQCQRLDYRDWWPQIASNGQSYALTLYRNANNTYNPSIMVGSLTGSAPITIATGADVMRLPGAHFDPFLQLVGMA